MHSAFQTGGRSAAAGKFQVCKFYAFSFQPVKCAAYFTGLSLPSVFSAPP